jgi:NhaP-type Na+/H+ or K+/H+ antiporter
VTVSVVVTFLSTAAVTYLVIGIPPSLALLIGALLVATGATVIEPLLASMPVEESLAATLEIETTFTEVAAGVLAVTVFNAITIGEPDTTEFAWVLTVGVVAGAAAWYMFTRSKHTPGNAPKHASQLYLATAVVTYAIAENVIYEAGVAAVADAREEVRYADLPYTKSRRSGRR